MYGKDYQWILQDQRIVWWKNSLECMNHELHAAVEGLIFVTDYDLLLDNETSVSGMVNCCVFL